MSAATGRWTAQLNAVFAAMSEVTGKLTTFAWTVVAARVLTQEQFGSFSFALALALMISSIAEWGFDPVVVIRGSRDRPRLPAFHTQAITWETLIGIPVFLAGGVAVWASTPSQDTKVAVAFVFAAVFLDLWSDTARSSAAAAQNQAGTATAVSLQRLTAAVLIIPALLLGFGIEGMVVAFFLASAVGWVAHVLAVRRIGIGFRISLVDRRGMLSLARGTFLIGLSSLVLMALMRIDTILLAAISGDRAVGEYASAYRLFETVLFLSFAVSGAVAPVLTVRMDDRAEVRRLTELSVAALGAVYVPFAVVALTEAPRLLSLIYGERYADAAGALRWLAVVPIVYGLSAVAGMLLVIADRTRPLLAGAVAALVVNLALNLALIPSLEGTGAAIATTVAYTIEATIGLAFAATVALRIRPFTALAEALVAAVPLAVALLLLQLPLLVELTIGLAAYAGTWLLVVRRRWPDLVTLMARMRPREGRLPTEP